MQRITQSLFNRVEGWGKNDGFYVDLRCWMWDVDSWLMVAGM